MEELKRRCGACRATARCKQAFGRFWIDKSHGGIGCMNPFDEEPAWARDGGTDANGAEGKPNGGTAGAEGRPNGGTAGGDPRTPHGRNGAEGGWSEAACGGNVAPWLEDWKRRHAAGKGERAR